MFTCSHANTPLGQSERDYYLSYFTKRIMYNLHIYSFHCLVSLVSLDKEFVFVFFVLLVFGKVGIIVKYI